MPAMAAIVLALAAVLQVVVPSSTTLPDRPKPAAPREGAEADATPVVRAFPAVMAHPIFAPDRAPPPAEAETAGNLSGVEVLGTAIEGKTAAAALVRDSDGTISRVKIGEDIDGWKLVSIAPSELTFDRNGERRSLTVDISAPKSTGPGATKMGASKPVSSDDSSDDSDDDSDQ
jgi:hypothetical protein